MSENAITPEGLQALKAELEELETTARNEMADRIRTAREWGDLKENAEYHDAKHQQALLETRILRLRDQIDKSVVVEKTASGDEVGFGSTATVADEESGREARYTIVGADEADASQGKISSASPVAQALIGSRVGDVVTIELPRGPRRLRVTAVDH